MNNHTITFKGTKKPTSRVLLLAAIGCLAALAAAGYFLKDKIRSAFTKPEPEPVAVVPAPPPLTPEEIALNATLENPELFQETQPAANEDPSFVLNTSSVVSFLLYHDFSEGNSSNPMVINIRKFREQMEAIKQAGLPVISLRDFLDWRAGKKNIPDRSIVITIDDGWVGVHQLALPVLKEYGYPFTLYLYTKYVAIGGRSLSLDQIKDIVASGGEIGSHSNAHSSLTSRSGRSQASYEKWLEDEIAGSKRSLEEKLKLPVTSFSYPYGNYNDEIAGLTTGSAGYITGVTVNGAKNTWETPLNQLNRFTILGNDDTSFRVATSFRGQGSIMDSRTLAGSDGSPDGPPTVPPPGAIITDRSPLIEVDLSGIPDIVPDSIRLKIGGLGEVIPEFDPATGRVSYQPTVRLRNKTVPVILTLNRKNESKSEILPWEFSIDHSAYYLEQEVPKAAPALPEPAPPAATETPAPAALPEPAPRATPVPES